MFIDRMKEKIEPSVLELGTKQSRPGRSTMHKYFVPHAKEYIGSDYEAGLDVDVLADVHELSHVFGEKRFDAVISCSTFEHLKYPWIAAIEICRVLKPGGLVFVQTHQTFPIHGYPEDYFRYTQDGLESLFSKQAGFKVIKSGHRYKCIILSFEAPGIVRAPSYLNSIIVAEKIAHPERNFVWRNNT